MKIYDVTEKRMVIGRCGVSPSDTERQDQERIHIPRYIVPVVVAVVSRVTEM